MTGEDPLDGRGGEVLAVDAQPFEVAAREVEVAGFVAVPEVAGPVPPVVDARRVGFVVLVVALEGGAAVLVDDLADRRVRVEQVASGIELRPWTFAARGAGR